MDPALHSTAYAQLQAENQALRQRLALAQQEAAQLRERQAQLEHELAQLKRLVFGTKRERFVAPPGGGRAAVLPKQPSQQQSPTLHERVNPEGEATPPSARKKPVRQALPAHLPREVIVVEPEEDPARLKKIGEEVTETLLYRPARLVVLRRVRPKYVDPQHPERGVIMASLPARPIEKGLAEASVLAHVVIEKYVDHMPLYRQVQRFTREGITLSGSTLGDWVASSAELLAPLYQTLKQQALDWIGRLYELERVLREQDATFEERFRRRQDQAVPVLEGLKAYLEAHPGLPKSPWGQAVAYSLGRWEKLCRYTEDGRIEIDNNLAQGTRCVRSRWVGATTSLPVRTRRPSGRR